LRFLDQLPAHAHSGGRQIAVHVALDGRPIPVPQDAKPVLEPSVFMHAHGTRLAKACLRLVVSPPAVEIVRTAHSQVDSARVKHQIQPHAGKAA